MTNTTKTPAEAKLIKIIRNLEKFYESKEYLDAIAAVEEMTAAHTIGTPEGLKVAMHFAEVTRKGTAIMDKAVAILDKEAK